MLCSNLQFQEKSSDISVKNHPNKSHTHGQVTHAWMDSQKVSLFVTHTHTRTHAHTLFHLSHTLEMGEHQIESTPIVLKKKDVTIN